LLIDKGADVNTQGGSYSNALQAASYQVHQEIVKLLIDKGADVNVQGGFYGNALQAASQSYQPNENVVGCLMENGAVLDALPGPVSPNE
jgi:ankyrin repeat protein